MSSSRFFSLRVILEMREYQFTLQKQSTSGYSPRRVRTCMQQALEVGYLTWKVGGYMITARLL